MTPLQVKKCWLQPELERARKRASPRASRSSGPADTLISDLLASSTVREYTCVLLSHLPHNTLLQQPQRSHTAMEVIPDFKKGKSLRLLPTPQGLCTCRPFCSCALSQLIRSQLPLTVPVPARMSPPRRSLPGTQARRRRCCQSLSGVLPRFYLPQYN